ALAAAEICWAAPIFAALSQETLRHQPLLLWLGMLGLLLGFFYLYRALARADLPLPLQQGLLLLALLLSIVLVVRYHVYAGLTYRGAEWFGYIWGRLTSNTVFLSEILAILALIYLWARGIHLARRSISVASTGYSFRAGIVILIGAGLGLALLARREVTPFVVSYFFFALTAIALARIEETSRLPGGSQAQFSGYWVGWSVVAVALLMAVGMAVALFFYGGSLEQILGWLSPIFGLLLILVYRLALWLAGTVWWLLSLLPIDWGALRGVIYSLTLQLRTALADLEQPSGEASPALQRSFQLGGKVGLIAVLITLVLLLTWYRRRRARAAAGADETHESLLSAGAVGRSLADLLQSGRQRLEEAAGRILGIQLLSAISIRRIYANLVRLATEQGYPRASAQTPYEYLVTLRQALPGSEAETALITNAYVNAHYGKLPDTPEELQQIRDAWDRVRDRQTKSKL
ncbi:MAG: DUF4129 domain-containing protein, partial [Anaerolineae bacterium]|nr:DUF4129 domain-containing protein [Anaerolineae bacterium]